MKLIPLIYYLLLGWLFLLPTESVHAHAFLDHSVPAVGSEVKVSPPEVKIWYTEKVEPTFSVIRVTDPSGKQIDKKDTHVDAHDQTLLIVGLPSLSPATYKVLWKVVSEDTHHTQGSFSFTLKP